MGEVSRSCRSRGHAVCCLLFALLLGLIALSGIVAHRHYRRLRSWIRSVAYGVALDGDFIAQLPCGVRLWIPDYPRDLVQRIIGMERKFFEEEILDSLRAYIPPNAHILDIGANIGNHSVYWATQCGAARIFAFEPMGGIFRILQRNIALNGLENVVIPFAHALSDGDGSLGVRSYDARNLGATALRKDPNGKVPALALDSIPLGIDHLDFVKIDVEDFEWFVLQGARETIRRLRPPYIFIEIRRGRRRTDALLREMGYSLVRKFQDDNFLYGLVAAGQ
jgi:FkbM family methyltransferase